MTHLELEGLTIAERYRVHEKVGEGAMGSVYRADDITLEREVALKVLRKEWVDKREVRQRLEHECRLMAKLPPHAHIVTLYDRLEHEGSVILVMEYVPGETLESVLERTAAQSAPVNTRKTTPFLSGVSTITLTQAEALDIVAQCLDALDYAHGRGVVHRDIKPSNILVMRDHNGQLRAKVMDFGIGKAVKGDSENQELTALTRTDGPGPGTPAYMAPEQIDPKRFGAIGGQADLYAMGVTLYEMLAMRLPFEGTFTELLHAHTNMAPPDPNTMGASVSRELVAVLNKALAKEPAQRYATAAAFRTDILAGKSGGTMIGGAPGYGYMPPPDTRKLDSMLPLLLVAGAIVLIAGGGLVAYTMLRSSSDEAAAPQTASPSSLTETESGGSADSTTSQSGTSQAGTSQAGLGPAIPDAPPMLDGAVLDPSVLGGPTLSLGSPEDAATAKSAAEMAQRDARAAFPDGQSASRNQNYALGEELLVEAQNQVDAGQYLQATDSFARARDFFDGARPAPSVVRPPEPDPVPAPPPARPDPVTPAPTRASPEPAPAPVRPAAPEPTPEPAEPAAPATPDPQKEDDDWFNRIRVTPSN
mgnify:CR=1 FL=1